MCSAKKNQILTEPNSIKLGYNNFEMFSGKYCRISSKFFYMEMLLINNHNSQYFSFTFRHPLHYLLQQCYKVNHTMTWPVNVSAAVVWKTRFQENNIQFKSLKAERVESITANLNRWAWKATFFSSHTVPIFFLSFSFS